MIFSPDYISYFKFKHVIQSLNLGRSTIFQYIYKLTIKCKQYCLYLCDENKIINNKRDPSGINT